MTPADQQYPALLPFIQSMQALWLPPPRLSLADWAERNLTLSSEYAARSSTLRLFGWQREIFNSFTDDSVSEIDLMIARQLTKTILIQAVVSYVATSDPGPIMLIYPDEDGAKAFSKERLAPMIRDCECLHGVIAEGNRDGNQVLLKEFPGGSLLLVGSRSSSGLRRRSVRYLLADEVDAYPASVGTAENKEGDPLTIATKGTVTFGSRARVIIASTPTTRGISRIGKAYDNSDQRKPYVACPYCGERQVLRFFRDGGKGGVYFDSSLSHDLSPATARYECGFCHQHWTDVQRKSACEQAEWRAHKPFTGKRGYWMSQLYSPWSSLADLVKEFLEVKSDRNLYRAFVNTVLAEEWVEEGTTTDPQRLYGRRESYSYGENAIVPARGLFLTAAVDVQENPPRLEVEVKAWGRGRENWSIDYQVLQVYAANGQPLPVTSPELWDGKLHDLLQRTYTHELGQQMPILAMLIDTGKRPKPVYDFARKHPQLAYAPATGIRLHSPRTVVPIKGTPDELRIISSISKEDAARKRQGVRIVGIGTHCVKQELFDALNHIHPKPDNGPSPGCYHFPDYQYAYFDGLCSEVRVVSDKGVVTYEKRGPRNEPLDLSVYGRAAAAIVGIDRFTESHWQRYEHMLGVDVAKPAASVVSSQVSAAAAVPSVVASPPLRGGTVPAVPPSPPASTPAVASTPARPAPVSPATGSVRRIRGSFIR